MIESIVLRTQIAWEYIYSYPLPVLAHTVASLSGNGTAVNTFYSKSNHLSVPADNSLTPNHDTIYSQAELDLSQVMGMSYMCTLASCVPMYCACEQDAHSGDLCCHCSTFECRSMLSNTHDDMLHPCTDVTRQASFAVCCMQGPQIVTVPQFDVPSRYWIVPFLDAYLNYYGAIGSDFNSTPGQYLVVGRNEPANATYANFTSDRVFHSPTDLNWIIARVLVFNDSDTATALTFSGNISLAPYNTAINGSLNTTSKAAIDSRAVNGSGYSSAPGAAYGAYGNQPANETSNSTQAQTLAALSTAATNATGLASTAFQLGRQVALTCILSPAANVGLVTSTGWTFHNNSGIYGSNYLLRAQDTQNVIAALPPQQVIYFQASVDNQNRTLDASTGNNYTITFPLPLPAQAFWSLTLYNATSLNLIVNPINRYTVNDRTSGLVYGGSDNSTLTVFISASQPALGTAEYANWLPAPNNSAMFFLLRTYEPPAYAIAGAYSPPGFVRIAPGSTSTAGK
ncbi:MAG: hypothetical protein FRX49_09030 [Trebouxia sp. A1-2]|nr:MAG: hypothetical protein FRX49_09030 [Trebouxia sp. A1-2]